MRYDPKRAEGAQHNAAIVCLTRLRCDVILALLCNLEPYRATAQACADPRPWSTCAQTPGGTDRLPRSVVLSPVAATVCRSVAVCARRR